MVNHPNRAKQERPAAEDKFAHAKANAKGWFESISVMVAAVALAEREGRQKDAEEAREQIEESPLSVQVRDGWRAPGDSGSEPEEYKILLTTGGPALRIYGRLNGANEPESAELQMQDWGIPWTRYDDADEETLLAFAQCFYFGEG